MSTRTRFVPDADPPCYNPRMTRAQAIAMRTAGTLRENCVVVITDGPTIGTPGNTSPTEIELNPVSPTELGLTARVHTTFDNSAWTGTYDIDLGVAGSITRLTDSSQNTVVDNDADSPTVHTQFPWHLGTTLGVGGWRDNYVEDFEFIDANLAVLPRTVVNNKFYNVNAASALNFTDWVSGTITDCEIGNFGGAHKIFGVASWQRSKIINATVNATTDTISLTGSEVLDISSVTTTGTGTISISASRIEDGAILLNAGEGNVTLSNSEMRGSSQIQNDAGSFKTLSFTGTTIEDSFLIRGQGGTILRSTTFSNSVLRNKPTTTDSITIIGDASNSFIGCDIQVAQVNGWVIDGPTTATSLQWTNVRWTGGDLTHGPLGSNCQWNTVEISGCIVTVDGPGESNFACNINNSDLLGTTIRHSAGVTETLTIQNVTAMGSGGVIAMDAATPRGLLIDGGTILSGPFSIIQTGTTASVVVGSDDDRVFNCTVQGGTIEFATTVGGTAVHNISNCIIVDGPDAPGVPDGRIRIDGTSAGVNIFQCQVYGDLVVTDAPQGALSSPTSMYDNYVGSSCFLTYVGGDAAGPKQIRNNRIEGNASRIDCLGLTGTAGAALADVFSNRVANQSTLTVTGARVPGFPVRNNEIVGSSGIVVPAGGSALQCSLRSNAALDTGAFVQFDSIVDGAFSKVATASNINALVNKSYDDWV